MSQPETKIGESPAYWTHKVDAFPSPVAQFRMAQLIDFDDRLYETARVVYRFMVGWYHTGYADALISQRHVAKVMKQRAPAGATVPSRNAVQRAIIALMDTGWVARSFQGRGKGKGASRYVPVLNVLELAAQGKFPQPAHANGPVEPAHANGPPVAHANGPVVSEPAHANGPKTLPPDSATEPKTGMVEINDCANPTVGLGAAVDAQGGIDELYSAYGVRREYAAAKFEYEKLAPSPGLHAEMVESAKAWRAAAGGIERMYLARWIREARFREDPKGEHKKTATKQKSVVKSQPATFHAKKDVLTITGSYVARTTGRDATMSAFFDTINDAGEVGDMCFTLEDGSKDIQERGQRQFAALCNALGVSDVEDSSELHGKSFVRVLRTQFGEYEYEPVPATLDMQEAA